MHNILSTIIVEKDYVSILASIKPNDLKNSSIFKFFFLLAPFVKSDEAWHSNVWWWSKKSNAFQNSKDVNDAILSSITIKY